MKYDFKQKKFLIRVWIIATVIWYASVILINAGSIGFWLGSQYSLLKRSESVPSALYEREKNDIVVTACQQAYERVCASSVSQNVSQSRIDENVYQRMIESEKACFSSSDFLTDLRNEARNLGLKEWAEIKIGSVCESMRLEKRVDINWIYISLVIGVSLLPLFLYKTLIWVLGGALRNPSQ